MLAAIAGKRGQAGQARDLFIGQMPKFGQVGEQHGGGHDTHTGTRAQDGVGVCERRDLHGVVDHAGERIALGCKLCQGALGTLAHGHALVPGALLGSSGYFRLQLLAVGDQVGQLAPGGIGCRRGTWLLAFAVAAQQRGVEAVGLGHPADGPGVIANALGVTDVDRDAGCVERRPKTLFLASTTTSTDWPWRCRSSRSAINSAMASSLLAMRQDLRRSAPAQSSQCLATSTPRT